MHTKTSGIWKTMHVLAWILFIGLCYKTGSILFSGIVSLFVSQENAKILYQELNLSSLYAYDEAQFVIVWGLIVVISALKAYMFYLAVNIFLQINFSRPFSDDVSSLISRIGYVALGIGVITIVSNGYCEWLTKRGVEFPDLKSYVGAGAEFLLMGGVIYMISQVFKRGIEIQSENELTV